jgi:hypothetical protein
MTETPSPEDVVLPLRDRLPEYLVTFGIGWAVILTVGVGVWLFTAASLVEGVAYVALAAGVLLLLAGGASGGGYTSLGLGAAGALFGSRQLADDDYDDPDVRRGSIRRANAMDRLRKGLRPEKNPRAFWQVVAGFINLGTAFSLLIGFGG